MPNFTFNGGRYFNPEPTIDWKSRAEKAESENTKLQDKLMNLLAVIHRDGGHYVSRHGLDRACKDAEKMSVYRVARVQELEGRIAEYLREFPKVRHEADKAGD